MMKIIFAAGIVSFCIYSCQSSGDNKVKSPTSTPDPLSTAAGSVVDAAASLKYDLFIPARALKQPKTMGCWATALTILYSWKNNDNTIKIEDVLKKYGEPYPILYETNAGIKQDMELKLYEKVKLTVKQRENPTIALWYDLLKNHGPLSITVAVKNIDGKRLIHALVVNGIKGKGNTNDTFIDYIDPADGKQHTQLLFSDFLDLYEGAANWPLQIIYWP